MVSGSGLCAKVVVVDARHHMLGRLASILAKELLNGQRVVSISSFFFAISPSSRPCAHCQTANRRIRRIEVLQG